MALPEELADLLVQLKSLAGDGFESITLTVEPDWSSDATDELPADLLMQVSFQLPKGSRITITQPFNATQNEIAAIIRETINEEIDTMRAQYKNFQQKLLCLDSSVSKLRNFVPSALEELAQQAEE